MIWIFAVVGLVAVVCIGLVVIGRETARLAAAPRPAVFDLAEAVDFIADRLHPEVQAQLSHDDVRWILLADADLLEQATAGPPEARFPWSRPPKPEGRDLAEHVVDQDQAVARILDLADRSDRDLADDHIVAVLDQRLIYLRAIDAIGEEADDVDDGDGPGRPERPEGSDEV